MTKRTISTLLITLTGTLISLIIGQLLKMAGDMALSLMDEPTKIFLLPYLWWGALGLIFFLFLLMVQGALYIGSLSYPAKDAKVRDKYKIEKPKKRWLLTFAWSQLRYTFISALLVIIAVFYLGFVSSFSLIHGLIIFFVVSDIFLQFYVATGLVRNNLRKTILQLLYSLGSEIELVLFEALGHRRSVLRIGIFTYSNEDQKLHLRYAYQMAGDSDFRLSLKVDQGVEGKTFSTKVPKLFTPFNRKKLGYTKQQQKLIPLDIKWKMAFPLWENHEPYGVLMMDCNYKLEKIWLDKMLDFVHATTIAASIIVCEYPGREIQKAFD